MAASCVSDGRKKAVNFIGFKQFLYLSIFKQNILFENFQTNTLEMYEWQNMKTQYSKTALSMDEYSNIFM